MDALRSARAPERFTVRFLADLGFKSTNDRLFLPVLKGLRLLDDNGVPTQRYFDFLDDTQWRRVLAEAIRDAYEDLYRLNTRAHTLTKTDISGKLKSMTEGKKSEGVIEYMAKTFLELSKLADFTEAKQFDEQQEAAEEAEELESTARQPEELSDRRPDKSKRTSGRLIDAVTYRIEIVLPPVRDKAVYDAIFRSLKEHLL